MPLIGFITEPPAIRRINAILEAIDKLEKYLNKKIRQIRTLEQRLIVGDTGPDNTVGGGPDGSLAVAHSNRDQSRADVDHVGHARQGFTEDAVVMGDTRPCETVGGGPNGSVEIDPANRDQSGSPGRHTGDPGVSV